MSYRKFHRLRVRFAELDLSQNEAARLAGISEGTMSSRMTGRIPFNIVEIMALCKVLDIPTDQIGAYFFEDAPKDRKAG